ncbi:MAG: class I SAM-dependent methyltransferase [Flavobacteriaceae bacterium]|jgi:SAM-dependent methyltransferase|nr:class I SAM-dependent methyltransferase [Flavobacteriaceae bacterium]
MTTKEHYDNHLGNFYSWMIGDLEAKQTEFQDFLIEQNLLPQSSKIAIDLGAGNGVQTVPLAKMGYAVKAIDFNKQLLDELAENTKNLNVEIINADIKNFNKFSGQNPELIVCCGDTIAHLDSEGEIVQLLKNISGTLTNGGKLLLTFRDYSAELTGENRFIPVKSDENKILTCVLDYQPKYVMVTDLLHEKIENSWKQKISSYKKVRVTTEMIVKMIEQIGMIIQFNETINRMITIIAYKK